MTLNTVQSFSWAEWISETGRKFSQRDFFVELLRKSQSASSNLSIAAVPSTYLNLVLQTKRTPENPETGSLLRHCSIHQRELWRVTHIRLMPHRRLCSTESTTCVPNRYPSPPLPISWSPIHRIHKQNTFSWWILPKHILVSWKFS